MNKHWKKLVGFLIPAAMAGGIFMLENGKPVDPNKTVIDPITFNGQTINFDYTDDNTGETLIIKTDQQTYSSWDSAYVYFAVKNITNDDQDTKIQFAYDGGANTSKVEELKPQVPYLVEVPDYAKKETCKMVTEPIGGKEKEVCGFEKTGSHQETVYKDEWGEMNKATVENLKSKDIKPIDSKFVPKEQVGYWIPAGATKYFRAKISFTPTSSGEFYINAYGHLNGFGTLDPWYSSSWGYRRQITLDYTKVATTSALTNFPLMFSTTTIADLKFTGSGGKVGKSDGTDILITASDGTTKLNHEIEKYSSSTGETILWFNSGATAISTSSPTSYYIYYGNSGASDQQSVTATWNSTFKGVWHQKDGTTLNLTDSTSNAHNGTNFSTTATTGQIDGGANFVQASSQYWTAGDHADFTFGNGGTDSAFSYSFWANLNTISGSHTDTWIEKYVTFGSGEYAIVPYFDSILTITNDTTGGYVGRKVTTASTYMSTGTWYYITWTYDGSKTNAGHKIYINGTQRDDGNFGGGTYTGMVDSGAALNMGKNNGLSGQYLDGKLDEIRLYAAEQPIAWIKTEYNNQSSPDTFWSVAAEETAPVTGGDAPGTVYLKGDLRMTGYVNIGAKNALSCTGGTITSSGGKTIHTFTSSGTFSCNGIGTANVLVVGGGGGGGGSRGGGGGAGGYITKPSLELIPGDYTVTVGGGGGADTNGSDSVFGVLTAIGGGAGKSGAGNNGGSGGGGGPLSSGGSGTTGQGNAGAASGGTLSGAGGGGASAVGGVVVNNNVGGNGGDGTANSISGASVTYAGGGGGACNTGGPTTGGAGGGGNGTTGTGANGTANTGGGGGGGGSTGGSGGSGIVIISY